MLGSNVSRWLANLPLRKLFAYIAMISFLGTCSFPDFVDMYSATLASGGICDASYTGVQDAKCLWVAAGESVGLQWDLNACYEKGGSPIQDITKLPGGETRQCTSRPMIASRGFSCALNTCYEGNYLVNNEPSENYPIARIANGFLKCTAPVDDDCHTMTRSCQRVQRACVGTSTIYNYPFCSLGCKQQIEQDQTLLLDVSGNIYFDPPVLSPQKFLAVGTTRRVARPTTFESLDRDSTFDLLDSDLMAGRLVRRYQVPRERIVSNLPSALADNVVLEENFSPSLFISRVRAFTSPNPASFARNYLNLNKLRITGQGQVDCSGSNADPSVVSSDNCERLGVMTPTYDVQFGSSLSAQALVWRIQLLDGAHNGNPGLTSDTPVFIEFTLANPASGRRDGVFLRTASGNYLYNFGVLPSGAQRTDLGALKLDLADSPVRWMVESVSTSSPQDFSLEVDGPDTVLAGGVRNINVTFHPSADGVKVAKGNVALIDPVGNHQSTSVDLQAQSGAQNLGVSPRTLDYSISTFPTSPLPWREYILLENDGSTALKVEGVTISGPDADSFSTSATSAFPIPSGGSELLRVSFCPARYGTFAAQVAITENEGTTTNPIVAIRTVSLQGSAYVPTLLCLNPTNFPFAPH